MIINTRDFGEIDVQTENIYRFSQPIFGFEEFTEYVILHDEEIGENIVWLQSTQNPGLCFIMMDPSGLSADFTPVLPAEAHKLLGEGDCYCWAIAVIPQNVKESTINLKSPVFLNPNTHLAAQIMLEGDYPVRFPLTKGGHS